MAEVFFDRVKNVFYDGDAIGYPMGASLRRKYSGSLWVGTEKELLHRPLRTSCSFFNVNSENVYLTVRGREPYSCGRGAFDKLVPYTSSVGYHSRCKGKCFYIYMNREEVMIRLLAEASKNRNGVFEIGQYTDIVAEDRITGNLPWTITEFAKGGKGTVTFASSFSPRAEVCNADHGGRTLFRMNVNPRVLIRRFEPQTSPLGSRIHALNKLAYAGYPCGIVIAPIYLCEGWEGLYAELIDLLEATLCDEIKENGTVELVFNKDLAVLKAKQLEAAEYIIRRSMAKLPNMQIIDIQ